MKVYIGKYRDHWISPYTMLDYAFFWTDWSKCSRDRRIRSLEEEGKYIEHPEWVERWSDRLKEKKHGAPFVEDEDVPEHLRSTAAPAKENEWDTDENHFKRWDWAMGEMIFAFECKVDDSWEDAFREGEHDIVWIPVDRDGNEVPKGEHKFYQMGHGPKDTYKCDYEGMKVVQNRIDNGFRLFGKYYQALWD